MTAVLEVDGLRKSYAGVEALAGVSFAVAEASITGLIGPNGSGKTTAIDCISGFQAVDGGRVLLRGGDITGRPPQEVARRGLLRTFQAMRLYERLSLRDNLTIAAQQRDAAGWLDELLRTARYRRAVAAAEARACQLLDLMGLARYIDVDAGMLSYGQKKLAALAAVLMPNPAIVVLDEPVAGVNPTRIGEVEEILRRLNASGQAFLVIEHNVEFITKLCHRVIVLCQGRKLAEGSPAAIHGDARVLEAYLGLTPEAAAKEMQGAA
jgi:ABC-type branched-subunit amino acid transport system ATPase component